MNKLTDLNDYLFEEIERLNNTDLSDEQLQNEIDRSKAITKVSYTIIENARLVLNGQKFMAEYARDAKDVVLPKMLEEKR